jgi:hypothetical protein
VDQRVYIVIVVYRCIVNLATFIVSVFIIQALVGEVYSAKKVKVHHQTQTQENISLNILDVLILHSFCILRVSCKLTS